VRPPSNGQGGPMTGEDERWDPDSPGLTVGFPRPVPLPVEGRWLVGGAASEVTSALGRWVTAGHGQVVRPPTEGVVAQFGVALFYRASSKNRVPRWDRVPVRFTARVTPLDGPRCRLSVIAVANPGPMMPAWLVRYPTDHYQRRPDDLLTRMITALSAQFTVSPDTHQE